MSEVINLRQQRKAKARKAKDQQAAENRAKHGRKKAEKVQQTQENQRIQKTLDNHLRMIPPQGERDD